MKHRPRPILPHETLKQSLALLALLSLGVIGLAGPNGLLAWGEQSRLLEARKAERAQLAAQREALRNRVTLLDEHHADPDLVGELLRKELNVAHPDELVIERH